MAHSSDCVRELDERPVPREGAVVVRSTGVPSDRRHPATHVPGSDQRAVRLRKLADQLEWPANLWMGVSVEDSSQLGRVDDLRAVPAAVRFLSCEPLLGPLTGLDLDGIGWVITGGESGPDARPVHPAWVRDIRDECQRAAVPFFHKQWGGRTPKTGGRELDGRVWDEMPAAAAV